MFGDNKISNKIAGFLLMVMLLYPIHTGGDMPLEDWVLTDWIHTIAAVGFFLAKSFNHRKGDWLMLIMGAATLAALRVDLYIVEFIGLYVLLLQGYLTKCAHFKKIRP